MGKGESDSGGRACSKPKQKSFFLFAEWPKFLKNKQVLPSYNAVLTAPALLREDS